MNTPTRASTSVDPEATYHEPHLLLEDASRSDAEKIKLLLDWRQSTNVELRVTQEKRS